MKKSLKRTLSHGNSSGSSSNSNVTASTSTTSAAATTNKSNNQQSQQKNKQQQRSGSSISAATISPSSSTTTITTSSSSSIRPSSSKIIKRSVPREISITGLDLQPVLPEGYEARAYEKIERAIDEIFKGQKTPSISFEEVHDDVSTLCMYGKGADLYAAIVKTCRAHISAQVDAIKK